MTGSSSSMLLQLLERRHAVDAGQHHVDDGGVERHRARQLEPFVAVRARAGRW